MLNDNKFQFKKSRDLGCSFLLNHQGVKGQFPEKNPIVEEYYKVLTAFQVCGYNESANHLCQWIRSQGFYSNGDFGPRGSMASGYAYAYFNAWLTIGAHRLGQFDLSSKGIAFVLGFQDEDTGGFYSHLKERNPETKQDMMVVSMCGLACLYTGEIIAARKAGTWLKSIMEVQPDFPNRLYTVFSREKGLETTLNSNELFRQVVIADSRDDQAFFNPGIAASFLCRLYQTTQEKQWLHLAIQYMQFAEIASDNLFRLIRAGKVGWAASLLFRLTGNEKYRAMAIRIGQNLLELQSREGYWSGSVKGSPNNDSTAERVIWMDEIAQVVN